ncbi:hypothetical protein EVAR_2458_1 [Eumeta japonica]|uniref:Uncharacterized protein n=1 Tax=Eumeta variegata TaxID=151549 RepID=A0A4C1SRB1_EUMVA|nr:hypothetical protein EVAR_2458_1 [Eumeta japonica]
MYFASCLTGRAAWAKETLAEHTLSDTSDISAVISMFGVSDNRARLITAGQPSSVITPARAAAEIGPLAPTASRPASSRPAAGESQTGRESARERRAPCDATSSRSTSTDGCEEVIMP